MRPALTSASQAGTQFTYPRGMEGWDDLGSSIAARPGIEPSRASTDWLQVRHPNRYATKSPKDKSTQGAVYMMKSRRPGAEPWDTRQKKVREEEQQLLAWRPARLGDSVG